jgi:hypothetical protein
MFVKIELNGPYDEEIMEMQRSEPVIDTLKETYMFNRQILMIISRKKESV